MDPYKLLGVQESSIKHPSDLLPVRERAKKLYKRYAAEKKKFDAKKVLEAFDQIKLRLKGRPGEGSNKILGRSRMERMMDKHYNRQTKDIKKDKKVQKELRKARKGEERFLLPGEKERISTGRGRKLYEKKKRRRRQRMQRKIPKKQVQALEGLQRLAKVISSKSKFPKAIGLVYRWMKEYMNQDNREFVFEVLADVTDYDFLTEDREGRQGVVMTFEYVFNYFKEWFDKADEQKALCASWKAATVLACQCHTDDVFTLTKAIAALTQVVDHLEKHKDKLGKNVRYDLDHQKPVKKPRIKFQDVKLEDGYPIVSSPEPEGSPCAKSEDDSDDEVKKEDADDDNDIKSEDGDDVKDEIKAESKTNGSNGKASKSVLAAPVLPPKDEPVGPVGPMPSPSPGAEVLDLSSDDEPPKNGAAKKPAEEIAIDSEDDDESIKEEVLSSDMSDDEDAVSIGDESDDCGESDDEVEMNIFPVPATTESLYRLRKHFIDRCCTQLFASRGPKWATSKVDTFFQDLFYRKAVFAAEQQIQIEAWQSRIKTLQREGDRNVGETNNILESARPVIDSREMRVVSDADSNVWAAKQTFDSRDTGGGRGIIR
eukprot:TRINITY_DN120991_c0_g1_i1.p1 TRINITY_DN120991_c0_g1~~TRINITY_DN120991_c0_g1_i1.p1  ORF type:complete len:598 (-),score=178.08 TRINITY_DN120991_c0_g1_i1:160-1953(-)